MTALDITFKPTEGANVQARDAAAEMRVYESRACPGMVSVILYTEGGWDYRGGTRLTREQVQALAIEIDAFLASTAARFTVDTAGTVTDGEAREPFAFYREHDGSLSRESAIFQALGAVSVCWDSMAGAGVFDSVRAKEIGDALVAEVTR